MMMTNQSVATLVTSFKRRLDNYTRFGH